MFSASDIVYVLSGGPDNRDPLASLGGGASLQPLLGTMDNLFNDLGVETLATGHVDWRCFYIVNRNPSYVFYDAVLFISDDVDGGAAVDLGFFIQNDRQALVFDSMPTNGGVVFSCENRTIAVEWGGTLDDFASQLVAALNSIFGDNVVNYSISGNTVILTFTDAQFHSALIVVDNTTGVNLAVQKLSNGSPLNASTVQIDSPTTPPNNITYYHPTEANPFAIGNIQPSVGFPVWVRRTVVAGATTPGLDGFSIRISGYPSLPPS